VVADKRGTGARARVKGMSVAGKTGTTQVVGLEVVEGMEDDEIPIRYRDHAWFVAFAPVEDPQIVVAVLVEHGGGGGSTAAPVAQRVLQAFAETRGIVPPPPESKLATLRADPAGGAHAVD
jgi:penicillin-binding protein 2